MLGAFSTARAGVYNASEDAFLRRIAHCGGGRACSERALRIEADLHSRNLKHSGLLSQPTSVRAAAKDLSYHG